MQDGVLEIASQVMHSHGISTVRFNFRGVGGSGGKHDRGEGEISDLSSVVEFVKPYYEHVFIGGYSFGAAVAIRHAVENSARNRLILIAPPTGQSMPRLENRTDVIVGEHDEISSSSSLREWALGNPCTKIHEITDADHFLAGYSKSVEALLGSILAG